MSGQHGHWAPPNQASASLTAYNHRGLLLRQLHDCVDLPYV
jgi:hypothetical protein